MATRVRTALALSCLLAGCVSLAVGDALLKRFVRHMEGPADA